MKRILFIGNSHTYMNDMPELARRMIESASGEACEAFMLAYSGRSLKWHMEEEYFSVRFNILHGGYDYCVLQEQAHPMTLEESTVYNAGKIAALCQKAHTIPVVFETWAEKRMPEHQAEMNRRYRKIARDLDALLAPVGEVWEKVMREIGDIPGADLYFRDGEHASPAGDYLAGMVIAKVITGKLPEEDFRTAFDFTVPGESWLPVKEDIGAEAVKLPEEIVRAIREQVGKCC